MRKGFLVALVVPVCVASGSFAQSLAPMTDSGSAQVKFDEGCSSCAPACKPVSWFKAEYLNWWSKNGPIPSPVLTSGTPASNGILGDPDTTILYSPGGLEYETRPGLRFTFGTWLDNCQSWGVEVSGFVLETGSTSFTATSDNTGAPLIAFPFIDSNTGLNATQLVASQDQLAGGATVSSHSHFWGVEANLLRNAWTGCNARLDYIVGYRQLGLAERLEQRSTSTALTDGAATYLGQRLLTGDSVSTFDQIKTNNHFYGGQLGARYTHTWGNLDLALSGVVALGWTHESYELSGNTAALIVGGAADFTQLGGLYVQGSNAGLSSRNTFSYVPEARADLSYHFCNGLSVGVGYTFIYWSRVARPGSQVDPVLDPTQIPSNAQFNTGGAGINPTRRDVESNYWAQGISVMIGYRY